MSPRVKIPKSVKDYEKDLRKCKCRIVTFALLELLLGSFAVIFYLKPLIRNFDVVESSEIMNQDDQTLLFDSAKTYSGWRPFYIPLPPLQVQYDRYYVEEIQWIAYIYNCAGVYLSSFSVVLGIIFMLAHDSPVMMYFWIYAKATVFIATIVSCGLATTYQILPTAGSKALFICGTIFALIFHLTALHLGTRLIEIYTKLKQTKKVKNVPNVIDLQAYSDQVQIYPTINVNEKSIV